jgi:hypothetical protein
MKNSRRPNYGLDAPLAVRNLLIVAALGIISLTTRLLGVWSRQDLIAVIARPLIGAGLSCGAMGLWMIYDSKIGKVREREYYLDKIVWRGDERVLDVGCGLGLFSSARPSVLRPAARSGSTCGRPRISAGIRRSAH